MVRKDRGFTLIELLVVVSIIALLIAILLPSLGQARERARLAVCQTRMRAWGMGFMMYGSTFEGRLPLDGNDGTTSSPIGVWNDSFMWFNGVVEYTVGNGSNTYNTLQDQHEASGAPLPKGGNNSLFVCPSAGEASTAAGSGDTVVNGYFRTTGWYVVGSFPAPTFAKTRDMLLCYGMNSQLRVWNMVSPSSTNPQYPGNPQVGDIAKLVQMEPVTKTVLLAEKRISADELPMSDINYGKALAQNKVAPTRFAARHKKGGNITFADAHVEWFSNAVVNKGLKVNNYNQPSILLWNPQ